MNLFKQLTYKDHQRIHEARVRNGKGFAYQHEAGRFNRKQRRARYHILARQLATLPLIKPEKRAEMQNRFFGECNAKATTPRMYPAVAARNFDHGHQYDGRGVRLYNRA